jgi:hypothetical protein
VALSEFREQVSLLDKIRLHGGLLMGEVDQNSTFIVEIPGATDVSNFRPNTATVHTANNGNIIQVIDTGEKPSSYWNDWGGWYDLPSSNNLSVFVEQFLTPVDTMEDLSLTQYSSFANGTQLYINLPFYVWQRVDSASTLSVLEGYSTNVPDYAFPSNDVIGNMRYPTRLKLPSTGNSLSDPLHGVNLFPTFSVQLENSDGFFDWRDGTQLINNPVVVLRSTSYPAYKSTFKRIRVGEVESVKLDMDKLILVCADAFKTLDDPVCRTAEEAGLATRGDILPIAYGTIKSATMVQFSDVPSGENRVVKYHFVDPDYFTELLAVRNDNGKTISSDKYTVYRGYIEITLGPDDIEPAVCDFIGRNGEEETRLGNIIREEVTKKSRIPYTDTFWDKAEFEVYANESPRLNILFKDGSVKSLITRCLKSDMAFFIQKNEGKLTVRKWGGKYAEYTIEPWMLTQKPSRTYTDSKYFSSSVIVEYGENSGYPEKFLNAEFEDLVVAAWKKRVRSTFVTNLQNMLQAAKFSKVLLDRFANRGQLVNVGVSVSTVDIELLDTVYLIMNVNGRILSTFSKWRVVGTNPSQDQLTLEEDSTIDRYDRPSAVMSHPHDNNSGTGFNSHVTSAKISGILSKNTVTR